MYIAEWVTEGMLHLSLACADFPGCPSAAWDPSYLRKQSQDWVSLDHNSFQIFSHCRVSWRGQNNGHHLDVNVLVRTSHKLHYYSTMLHSTYCRSLVNIFKMLTKPINFEASNLLTIFKRQGRGLNNFKTFLIFIRLYEHTVLEPDVLIWSHQLRVNDFV